MKKLRSILFSLCLVGLFSVTICNHVFCEEIDSNESAEQSNMISVFGMVAEPAESTINHTQENEESCESTFRSETDVGSLDLVNNLENHCEVASEDTTVLYKEFEDAMETLSMIENHRYENYKIQKLLEEQAAASVYLNDPNIARKRSSLRVGRLPLIRQYS